MFRVITTQTRPNIGVEFFSPKTSTLVTEETKMHIRNNYILTGKIVDSEETVSADGLVLTLTVTYLDEDAYTLFQNDQVINENVFDIGRQYRETNGITSVIASSETI